MNPWHLAWIVPLTAILAASAGLFIAALMFAPDDDEDDRWLCAECADRTAAVESARKEGIKEGWDEGWRACAVAQLIEQTKVKP